MRPRVFFVVGLLIHTASYPFVCRPCTLGKSKRASNDFVVDYVAGVKLVHLHKQKKKKTALQSVDHFLDGGDLEARCC